MSHKHYINDTRGELRNVLYARNFSEIKTSLNISPFTKRGLMDTLTDKFQEIAIRLLEKIIGRDLFVENHLKELASKSPEIRSLLFKFISNGFIKSWTVDVVTQTKSYIVGVTIEINKFSTKKGKDLNLIGAMGCGTGYSLNEAFIPALAELIERHAAATFDEDKLFYGSERALKAKGAVNLDQFRFFREAERKKHPELRRNNFNEDTLMYWEKGLEITKNKKILLPAQLVYYFIAALKEKEPFFYETNSNGTAAHTSERKASVRAILEVVERDAFLLYWLQKRKPFRIKKETVTFPEIKMLIQKLEEQTFKIDLLYIQTEVGVPTIVAVISGSSKRTFVVAGAASEFDLLTALRKSIFEAARMAQFFVPPTEEELEVARKKYPMFTTFKERHDWWSAPENSQKIKHFLSGEEIESSQIIYPKLNSDEITDEKKQYRYLTLNLEKNNMEAYIVDITSQESKDVGLYVKKAIIPKLIPAYFKEFACPLGLERLNNKNYPIFESIPHPFL